MKEYEQRWGKLHVEYVPSHMDDFVTADTREEKLEILRNINYRWKGNVDADEKAEEAYQDWSEVSHRELAALTVATVCYRQGSGKEESVLVPYGRWAKDVVRKHHIVQHLQTHPLLDGDIE